MIRKIGIFFCLLSLCSLLTAGAQEQGIVDKIQNKYESLSSFKSNFEQKLTNAASGEVEMRKGQIAFKQPRHIHWSTTSPEKELLIVGTDFVWDYYPDEEIAYKYSLGKILKSKTMLRFLSGEANIREDFQVQKQGMENDWQKIKLVPHNPEPNLVLAYIWAEPDSGLVRQILLVDFFGNGNQLTLKDLKLNPQLDKDLFTLALPDEVEVIDARSNALPETKK